MNREIKFRAWDEGNKLMHNDFQFIRSGIEGNDWILFVSDRQPIGGDIDWRENPYFAQQLKIMQYTDLKDANGVEIFEGDIVRVRGRKRIGVYHTVILHKGAGFYLDRNDTYLVDDKAWLNIEAVIGNIYEHPHLLEQSSPSEAQ